MRVIKKQKLEEFFAAHPQGKKPLLKWFDIIRGVTWRNFAQLRETFRDADEVTVASGKKAVIFNIKRNDYRLITAVHYEKEVMDEKGVGKIVEGKIFLFFFLTHAEYDKDKWKSQL